MKAYLSRSGQSPRVIIKDGRKQMRSKSFPGSGGLAKAKSFAQKFNDAEERAKELEIIGTIPIDLLLNEFWEKRVCMLSPGYQSHAKAKIFNHLIPWFGGKDVRTLNEDDIRAYAKHLFSTPPPNRRKRSATRKVARLKSLDARAASRTGYAYGTVVNEVVLLRTAINGLVDRPNSGLDRNPVPKAAAVAKAVARGLHVAPRQIEAWSEDQLAQVLDITQVSEPRVYPHVYFVSQTGCRLGEMFSLRTEDLDLANNIARIRRTKTRREREIDLDDYLCEFIEKHLSQLKRKLRVTRLEFVFPSPTGGPWN